MEGLPDATFDGVRVDKDSGDKGFGQQILDLFTYAGVSYIDNVTQPSVKPTDIYIADKNGGVSQAGQPIAGGVTTQQIPPMFLLVGGAVFLYLLLK